MNSYWIVMYHTMVFRWGHSRSRVSSFLIKIKTRCFHRKTSNVSEIYWFKKNARLENARVRGRGSENATARENLFIFNEKAEVRDGEWLQGNTIVKLFFRRLRLCVKWIFRHTGSICFPLKRTKKSWSWITDCHSQRRLCAI